MNRRIAVIIALAAVSSGCTNLDRSRSLADPNVSGQVIAQQVCSNCHGLDGNSESPNFPNLAGQMPDYLIAQLSNFRSHSRSDPAGFYYMFGMSRTLTDQQIEGLAKHYAQQTPKPIGVKTDPQIVSMGKAIYDSGIPESQVPPCAACHGPDGNGMAAFPRLAGQHQDYMVKQLMVFQRDAGRPNTPMTQVAHGLSEEQVDAVTGYLQTLTAAQQ